jgi:tRNA pseudouridine38-40 synthase
MSEGRLLVFEIAADAFLYHMVRRLVSVQVEVGQGRLEVEALRRCVEEDYERSPQGLAPARGLVLTSVSYENDLQAGFSTPAGIE